MIKLVYVIRAREDMSGQEFHRYWREEHAPKVLSVAKAIGARRYVQSHTVDTPVNAALVESRGMAPIYEGITEVWWDSLDDLQATMGDVGAEDAMRLLLEDEAKFIDFGRSTIFMTEEHEIFDFTR